MERSRKRGPFMETLTRCTKQRRKRYRAYDRRGRLAEKRHISERPATAETCRYKGH